MIQKVEKKPKIALCRRCYGTGRLHDRDTGVEHVCEQCEGSGRVTVSAKLELDIRPYKAKKKE